MDRERIRRRADLLERFVEVRSPQEGLLRDEEYVSLIETFLDTRAGRVSDEEVFTLVSWADATVLRSRLLELVIRSERGVDLDSAGELLMDEAPPAHMFELARDRIPAAYQGAEPGVCAARLAFAAARLNAERPWSEEELRQVEGWAQETETNRALLDLMLAYPDLGFDVTRFGQVVILPAGPAL